MDVAKEVGADAVSHGCTGKGMIRHDIFSTRMRIAFHLLPGKIVFTVCFRFDLSSHFLL